jgi:hypothetical protein
MKSENIKRLERWMSTQLAFAYKSNNKEDKLRVVNEAITKVRECEDIEDEDQKLEIITKLGQLLVLIEEEN